jgi:hypothetical protein
MSSEFLFVDFGDAKTRGWLCPGKSTRFCRKNTISDGGASVFGDSEHQSSSHSQATRPLSSRLKLFNPRNKMMQSKTPLWWLVHSEAPPLLLTWHDRYYRPLFLAL